MAARSEANPWFDSFDVEAEVATLLAQIERWTGFALPARKSAVVMSYANAKLDKTRQVYQEAKAAGQLLSTSRRAFLTEIQDTIFMAIPEEPRKDAAAQAGSERSRILRGGHASRCRDQ